MPGVGLYSADSGAWVSREMENNLAMDYYRKTGIVLPVVAVLLSVTVMLRAQDGVPEMPEDTLSEVVVTADRIREIVPAQKLAGRQLERLRSNSVADALRYFSGVQVKDYGGIGGLKTVNVRSLGSQHVGVFYDGIQISNAQNGTVDLGKFSMDNMEVLSVYNGQKSAGPGGGSVPPLMWNSSIRQGVTSSATAGKEVMTLRRCAGTGM